MQHRVACAILLALAGAVPAAAAPAAPPRAPAIGYDWMPDAAAAGDPDPDPWPRADAADSGLDDMIRAERRPLESVIGAVDGGARPAGGDRLLRTLHKVSGDYVVVPLLTLHLDHAPRR